MVELVNRDRQRNKRRALTASAQLAQIAREHSRDMADNDFFNHRSPATGVLEDRLEAAGIIPKWPSTRAVSISYGENIAVDRTVAAAQANLMESPGHRKNILNRKFTQIGIGIVQKEESLWITQVFSSDLD